MNRKGMPAELMNELFGSLPFENAFGLLAKMTNAILARNVQKMINGIKEAMKNNKLNEKDCGPKLAISENGFIAKHLGPEAILPIPSFNLMGINKPIIAFYFEMQILNKSPQWVNGIGIGFCEQHFPLEGEWLGGLNNSIGIGEKGGIWIDESYNEFGNDIEYFTKGDYIGIGIIHQPNSKIECFATWNGKLLGKVQLSPKFAIVQIFPAVDLDCGGDSVRVNFGKEEWQFKEFGSVL